MKKIVMIVAVFMLLTGCSSVSQEEYNSLCSQNSNLESLICELQTNKANLEEKMNTLTSSYDVLNSSYEQLKKDTEQFLNLSEAERQAEIARLEQEEADRKAQEEAEQRAEEAKGYETGITFDEISRSPDKYNGKKVKFTGSVLQILEGYYYNEGRMSTSGDYKDVVYFSYDKDIVDVRLLEKDKITIYGTFKGLYTYETVVGGNVTLPKISVDIIEFVPENSTTLGNTPVLNDDILNNISTNAVRTQDGYVCVFLTNNNDFVIGEIELQLIYKDANGIIVDTESARKSNISPAATVVYSLSAPDNYSSFEVIKSFNMDYSSYYKNYYEFCSIEGSQGEKCIIIQCTNNSDETINSIEYAVVFYKGNNVVESSRETLYDVLPHKTEIDKVNTYNTDYDHFEIYLNYAYGSVR